MGCDKELDMISILAMRSNLKEVMGMEVYVEVNTNITEKEIVAGLFGRYHILLPKKKSC
jgi:hypothetical protein